MGNFFKKLIHKLEELPILSAIVKEAKDVGEHVKELINDFTEKDVKFKDRVKNIVGHLGELGGDINGAIGAAVSVLNPVKLARAIVDISTGRKANEIIPELEQKHSKIPIFGSLVDEGKEIAHDIKDLKDAIKDHDISGKEKTKKIVQKAMDLVEDGFDAFGKVMATTYIVKNIVNVFKAPFGKAAHDTKIGSAINSVEEAVHDISNGNVRNVNDIIKIGEQANGVFEKGQWIFNTGKGTVSEVKEFKRSLTMESVSDIGIDALDKRFKLPKDLVLGEYKGELTAGRTGNLASGKSYDEDFVSQKKNAAMEV